MPQLPSHLARAAKEFSQVRRQHFFYWEAYESILQKLDNGDRNITAEINSFTELERLDHGYVSALGSKLEGCVDRISLEYSAGASMEEIKDLYPIAIDAFEEWCGSFVKWAYHRFPERQLQFEESGSLPCPVEADVPDSYRELLRVISLGVLLGEHDQLRRIAKLIVNIRGIDTIIEELLLPFVPDPMEINKFCHLDLYDDLIGAAWEPREESTKCMANFLGRWYEFFEGAFWHDAHLRFGQLRDDPDWANYYGYWAWEAGAIAYLYELDDSAYRDHILYPKDLVDWARRQGPVPKHYTPPAHELPIVLSAKPGQPCPRAGVWFAPHLRMKEVTMKLGEPMPSEQVGPTGGVTWYFRG